MRPLIIKCYNEENTMAHMYQADYGADKAIADDFVEILDKIIIDIYLKENVFSKHICHDMSDDENQEFVMEKRRKILGDMAEKEFILSEYLDSVWPPFPDEVQCLAHGGRVRYSDKIKQL